ncbi:MAG: N-acetyltransferase [Microbacteriaceae bacterium]|nr:N-acetyltransferase [Cryobacterium sp.]MCC7128216.1 N-acetyltransferase [Microbacteriaceae bacterium]
MGKEFKNETESSRYTLRIDGEIASAVDYKISGDSISFTHTFTDAKRRGQGLAGEIVEFAVNDVEQSSNLRIVPMCWYVGEWFDKHPDRAQLLSR